jgi:N-carbamoylputrescine amidase
MENPRKFTLGLVQMSMTTDSDANLEKAVHKVEEAAEAGAEVICLPELFRSQYFCKRQDFALFNLAEPIPGPATVTLGKIAKKASL